MVRASKPLLRVFSWFHASVTLPHPNWPRRPHSHTTLSRADQSHKKGRDGRTGDTEKLSFRLSLLCGNSPPKKGKGKRASYKKVPINHSFLVPLPPPQIVLLKSKNLLLSCRLKLSCALHPSSSSPSFWKVFILKRCFKERGREGGEGLVPVIKKDLCFGSKRRKGGGGRKRGLVCISDNRGSKLCRYHSLQKDLNPSSSSFYFPSLSFS